MSLQYRQLCREWGAWALYGCIDYAQVFAVEQQLGELAQHILIDVPFQFRSQERAVVRAIGMGTRKGGGCLTAIWGRLAKQLHPLHLL